MTLKLMINHVRFRLVLMFLFVAFSLSAFGQCNFSFSLEQISPTGSIYSPQYATVRATYQDNTGGMGIPPEGEFRWYNSATASTPVATGYVSEFATTHDYSVYVTTSISLWVSYWDQWSGCETSRVRHDIIYYPAT